ESAHGVDAERLQILANPHGSQNGELFLFQIVVEKTGPPGRRKVDFELIQSLGSHFSQYGQPGTAELGSILRIANQRLVGGILRIERRVELQESRDLVSRVALLLFTRRARFQT